MDKKILFVLFLLLSTALVAAYMRGNFSSAKEGGVSVRVGKTNFDVEIADSLPTQARGLSGHAPLANHEGMLFIFSSQRVQVFWMKGMLFPIDIIWIREGRVVGFEKNAPVPTGSSTPTFSLGEPVDMVLEVAAGTVARDGINIGDEVVVSGR